MAKAQTQMHHMHAVIRIRPASAGIVAYFYDKEEALAYAKEMVDGENTSFYIEDRDITLDVEDEDEDYDEEHDDDYWDHYEYDDDRSMFADPGGNSALRAATKHNPRNLPCPTCHRPNLLTPADRALGYQCDRCADRAERGVDY